MALCFKFNTGDGQETEAKFMDNTRALRDRWIEGWLTLTVIIMIDSKPFRYVFTRRRRLSPLFQKGDEALKLDVRFTWRCASETGFWKCDSCKNDSVIWHVLNLSGSTFCVAFSFRFFTRSELFNLYEGPYKVLARNQRAVLRHSSGWMAPCPHHHHNGQKKRPNITHSKIYWNYYAPVGLVEWGVTIAWKLLWWIL